jgi:DNA-binding response OmpR family regulator
MANGRDGILIVEDEALIGFDLADLLTEAGYDVRGPFASIDRALNEMDKALPCLAILDVNLGEGGTSERVAERLEATGTPMVFVSGYTPCGSDVLRRFSAFPRISKPWDPQDLLRTIDFHLRTPAEYVA